MRIICCTNPERGDDAAGIIVATQLRKLGIEVQTHTRDALSLIEEWAEADDIVLVDTVVTGSPAGKVHFWEGDQFTLPRIRTASTHGFSIAEAIKLARTLGGLPRRLRVYGIEGRSFGLGRKVSLEVKRAAEEVAQQIAAEARSSS